MAQQESSQQLHIYRVHAVVGNDIYTLHTHGWNGLDALQKIGRRLRSEGHYLYTLSIIDRKEIP